MRKKLLSLLVLLTAAASGAWAEDDEVTLTPQGESAWTFTMPAGNVELEVEYYTDEELYTDGVELTKTDKNTWQLASMPAFDVELEVEYDTELALAEEDDNSEKLTEWNGYEANATLTRTLQTGSWNTFAAPFDIDAATMTAKGMTAKKLTESTLADGLLTLTFTDATSIEAGKPYLVKVAENVENPVFETVLVSSTTTTTETDAVDFIPTLGKYEVTGDADAVLFLGASNTLYHPETLPANMKGFRAYFQLKGETAAAARAFCIDFGDGETTGIKTIDNGQLIIDNSSDGAAYTLDGRRLQGRPTQKGVYVVNGKKVIIK